MGQIEAIMNHLESGKSITPLEALKKYGCMRLASRITDIRNNGVSIKTEIVSNKRTGKHYAKYSLEGRAA